MTPSQPASKSFARNWRDALIACATPREKAILTEGLSRAELQSILSDWEFWARDDQLPPPDPWHVWLMVGGRGAGKTRAGAEWIKALVAGHPRFTAQPVSRIALIGETIADVRDVMVEGVSGLLSLSYGAERPRWQPTRRRLVWPNGAIAQAFSAEDPESLRGPQFEVAWCDEIGKWKQAEQVWDMLQFGLRLGQPRQLLTTTPRNTALLRKIMAREDCVVSRAPTRANARNLSAAFLHSIRQTYAGTALGRQELEGEFINDVSGALWSRAALEHCRVSQAPPLRKIVVAVDPAATSGRRADACGLIVAGIDAEGRIYVLEDKTIPGARPAQWASAAVSLYHRHEADCLVAQVNQGGEMVSTIIAETDAAVLVTSVRARRGKYLRAAPVAQLYEQGRVHHVGPLPALEDELCAFGLDGLSNGKSPDRLDALVWAVTELALKPATAPRIRGA